MKIRKKFKNLISLFVLMYIILGYTLLSTNKIVYESAVIIAGLVCCYCLFKVIRKL